MSQVALITGGTSTEREISLRSAAHVAELLQDQFSIQTYDLPTDLAQILNDRHEIDIAIPLIHGRDGEDGSLQGFLHHLQIPFLFSDITAHAIGLDKSLSKGVVSALGVPVAANTILHRGESLTYTRPVAVKQIDGGSSIGVVRADSQARLDTALQMMFQQHTHALIEPWIEGQEFTVGVIDTTFGPRALPVTLIQPRPGTYFDFEQKYSAMTLAEELCPAPIHQTTTEALQKLALTAHAGIGAKHLSRSDFIVDRDGAIWFLEINTIPGMTETSLLPKMLIQAGTSLKEQLTQWIYERLTGASDSLA